MKKYLEKIISELHQIKGPIIIGISGFGGAGKSTFAKMLSKELEAPIVGVDSFSKSKVHENYELWDVMDFQRIESEVIQPFLSAEKTIEYGEFDWGLDHIKEKSSFENNGLIIIEGVGLFRPSLNKYFNYKIWVECSVKEAIKRGKKRDREDYGNPQDEYWDGIWKKNDSEYFDKFKPKESVDLVVNNSEF